MKIFAIALGATLVTPCANALVIQAYDATAASGGLVAFMSDPGVVSTPQIR
ncbi:hypothetical protein [uncultured Albimonas sp.]|uniref:hypothetical protein n=1 Tax=uncultured Albimonas sp. TaxID=1331701 RepID=UPI0030EF8151|tara:strand:- start:151 stop:303 length:153 start_codon:yes stop_codon:yes gene_type:complete